MKRETANAILAYVVVPVLAMVTTAAAMHLLLRYPSLLRYPFLRPALIVAMLLCAGALLWVNSRESKQSEWVVLAAGIFLAATALTLELWNIESVAAAVLYTLGVVCMWVAVIKHLRRRLRQKGKQISGGGIE